MECRANCGMCCIIPSINSAIPGMPHGKPSGEICVNLDPITYRCRIWGMANYPPFCRGFAPSSECCGQSREEAKQLLITLEQVTQLT